MKTISPGRSLRGTTIFITVFLLAIFGLPFIPFVARNLFHYRVENFLFFWPQYALLPYGFREAFGNLMHITIPAWVVGAMIFGVATNRLRAIYVVLLAYPTQLAAVFSASWLAGLLGYSVYLDGP